jgi:hypothetical protein
MIAKSEFFVPLLSANVLRPERRESYFRKEWAWAVDRHERFFGNDQQLLRPVLLDGVKARADGIPHEFAAAQGVRVEADGRLPEAFCRQMVEELRELRRHQRRGA